MKALYSLVLAILICIACFGCSSAGFTPDAFGPLITPQLDPEIEEGGK